MQSRIKKHIHTESFIELIQGALEEEGCQTKRYSDGDRYTVTNAYDCIMVKGADGNFYELIVNECSPRLEFCTDEEYNPAKAFENIDKYVNRRKLGYL